MHPDRAETHVLADERATRAYMEQLWAEVMEVYRSGKYSAHFNKEMEKTLAEEQTKYQQEDTLAGQIYDFMDRYQGDKLCTKQIYKEGLEHTFDEPKQWEIREIYEIVNTGIEKGELPGWRVMDNPRRFKTYGKQRGWERVPVTTAMEAEPAVSSFVEDLLQKGCILSEDDDSLPF